MATRVEQAATGTAPEARTAGRRGGLSAWLVLMGAGFGAAALCSRSSARPLVLGRYSPSYAALLSVYLLLAALAVRTAWSGPRWQVVRQAWRGLGIRAAAVWAGAVGIPLGIAFVAAEDVVGPLVLWLAGGFLLAAGLTLVAPRAARGPLALLGRWGRGRTAANVALIMVAMLSAFVAIELVLRTWQPPLLGRGPFVMDPEVGGYRIDHGREGNRLGFRDADEYAIERGGVAFRAVAVGDSFTMGTLPLEETWKRRLEMRLRRETGGRVEVINLGIGATGPRDYLRVLKTLGLRLAPDLVLVGFYVGNDFMDDEPGQERTLVDGWPMEVRHRAWFGGLTPERFYVMTYLTRGLKPLWDAYQQRRELRRGEIHEGGTYSREAFLRQRRYFIRIYERGDSPWFQGQWGAVQGWLREMHRRARERGAEFVLMLFPEQIQVEDGLRREALDSFHLDAAAYDFEKPQRLLRAFAAENGIRVVDMLPRFRAEGRAGGLYLVRDTHWNAAGNRLAADLLYDYLTAEHLVPQRAPVGR